MVIKLQRTSKYLIVFRLQLWVWLVACGGGACFGRKSLRHCASSHRLRGHCSGRWRLGWKDCCCGCLLLNLLAISTRLCSVTVSGVMLLTASDLRKKKKKSQAWKEVALHLRFPPSRLAVRERQRRSTCCCCGTPPLVGCCWIYVRVVFYLYTLVSECALTRRLLLTLPFLAGWPRGCGKRGTCAAISIIPIVSC